WQLLIPAGKWIAGKAAEAILSLGIDRLFNGGGEEKGKLGEVHAASVMASAHPSYERDLTAGLEHSAIKGMVGELGAVSALQKVMGFFRSGASEAGKMATATRNWFGRKIDAGKRVVQTARDVASTANQVRQIVDKLQDSKKRESLTPSEVIKLVKGFVTQANQLLGECTGTAPGEQRLLSELAGLGYAIGALRDINSSRGFRRRLGWRPNATEYALGCCCQMANDPAVQSIRRSMQHGVFDAATNRHAAALRAQHALNLPDASQLSPVQVGELGATTDFFQALAQGAQAIFQDLASTPVGSAVIDGARQVVSSLVGNTQQAQQYQQRDIAAEQYLQRLAEERMKIEQARAATASLPERAGLDAGLQKIADKEREITAIRDEVKSTLAELKDAIAADRAKMAPVAAIVGDQREKAKQAETQRLNQVEEMSDRGLLRGRVQVLSIQEYSDLVKQAHEANAASEKLRMQAEQLSRDYQTASKKVADFSVQIVELRRQLDERTRQLEDIRTERETAARVEAERAKLEQHLQRVTQGFQDELARITQMTDATVQRAGDVAQRSGITLGFDLLRQIVSAMGDVRNVSQTGEFLQLFPRVLEQLRLAQQIASPKDPVINVQVPPQQAPTVNIPRTEPPTFIISPTLDVRPAAKSEVPQQNFAQQNFAPITA
ncbi:MAG: hypothetical protein AB7S36_14390, partial [Planctomycetota bacterium]